MDRLFEGSFVTAACLVLDTAGQGALSLAGHSCPYRYDAGEDTVEHRSVSSFPLGVSEDAAYETRGGDVLSDRWNPVNHWNAPWARRIRMTHDERY